MKSAISGVAKNGERKARTRAILGAALLGIAAVGSNSRAATVVFTGGSDGTGSDLSVAGNYSTGTLPSPATPDTIQFSGTGSATSLVYSSTASLGGSAGNTGLTLSLTATQTAALSIDSGTNTTSLRIGAITMAAGSGALTIGDGNDKFNITIGGTSNTTQTFTNYSSSTLTFNSDVVLGNGGGSPHTYVFTSSTTGATAGNIVLNNALTNLGATAIQKLGDGTLTINSANNTISGAITIGGGNFPLSTLRANATGALGTGTISILGNNGGGLLQVSNGSTLANAITLSAKTAFSNGPAIESVSGNNAVSGLITMTTGGNYYAIQADDASGLFTVGTAGATAITGGTLTGSRYIQLQGTGNGAVVGNIVSGTATTPLSKAGAGTWTLSGNNTYTGGTTISAGTLVANSTTALSTGTVSVTAGTLGIGAVNVGGISGLTMADSTTLSLASTSSVITLASGTFSLGAVTVNLNNAFNTIGTYILIDGVAGSSDTLGATTVTGLSSAYTGTIAYDATNGDAVLTVKAVPEPASLALIGLGAAGLIRRRRATATA